MGDRLWKDRLGERPEQAAVRELREETGLDLSALYDVTVSSFFLHATQTIQMAIVFAAFVESDSEILLSDEHQRFEWLSLDEACDRFTWPRAAHVLRMRTVYSLQGMPAPSKTHSGLSSGA